MFLLTFLLLNILQNLEQRHTSNVTTITTMTATVVMATKATTITNGRSVKTENVSQPTSLYLLKYNQRLIDVTTYHYPVHLFLIWSNTHCKGASYFKDILYVVLQTCLIILEENASEQTNTQFKDRKDMTCSDGFIQLATKHSYLEGL